jgi:hypothetical protein
VRHEESDKIEFTSFILSYDIFWIQAAAVTIAFVAFLSAVPSLLKEREYRAIIPLFISFVVIGLYLLGHGRISAFLFL